MGQYHHPDITSHTLFLNYWPSGSSSSMSNMGFDLTTFGIVFFSPEKPSQESSKSHSISFKPLLKCHFFVEAFPVHPIKNNPTLMLSFPTSLNLPWKFVVSDMKYTYLLLVCFLSVCNLHEGLDLELFMFVSLTWNFHSVNINAWINHLSKTCSYYAAGQISPKEEFQLKKKSGYLC